MNTNRWYPLIVLALLAAAGCASPASRIKNNPELFASFPPEVQEVIRRGEVDIGFTPEMVTMALGAPNRLYTRTEAAGTLEVWSYTATTTRNDRQRVQADFRYRDSSGRSRTTTDWVWVDVARDTEYERIRVEFREGVVVAIDRLQR